MIVATRPDPTVRPPSRCYGGIWYTATPDKMGTFFIYIIHNISVFLWFFKILEAF